MERTEDTYSIILRDHESTETFYIAEVRTYGDIERIRETIKQLNEEYREETNEWDDFYEELGNRTGLNIYDTEILYS